MANSTPWFHTRDALTDFTRLLACMKCNQRPIEPIKYTTCNHHFCKNCVHDDSNCCVCGVPILPSDVIHDFITANIFSACDSIFDIVFQDGDAGDFLDDPDPNKRDNNENAKVQKESDRETISSHKSSGMETNLEDLLDHQLLSSTRNSIRFVQNQPRNETLNVIEDSDTDELMESDKNKKDKIRHDSRQRENQSRIERQNETAKENTTAEGEENIKKGKQVRVHVEVKQMRKNQGSQEQTEVENQTEIENQTENLDEIDRQEIENQREIQEQEEIVRRQRIEKEEELKKQQEIEKQREIEKQELKKRKEMEKREIAKQKKLKKQKEMEKENNARSTRKRKGQIDIIRYRSVDGHREDDENIKKQKKIEKLKEVEKQKEIEFAKFRNIERRRKVDQHEKTVEQQTESIEQQAKIVESSEIVKQTENVERPEIIEETQNDTIDEQQMEIDEQQITGHKDSRNNTDFENSLHGEIRSSMRSKAFHNTRSRQTVLSNIIEETPSSCQSDKIGNSGDDTVILKESDQLDNTKNTVFNEPKSVKPSTSKGSRSRSSSLTKSSKLPKDVNKKNKKGETLLHQACLKGQEETVKMLLENGANPNTKDHAFWTPLQEVINLGHYRICEMLLENGASPNTPGIDNQTALHEAVINNRVKETELLLRFNADPSLVDQFGKSPIDYCKSDEIKKLLTQDNLLNNSRDLNCSLSCSVSTAEKIIVLACNLQPSTKKSLSALALKHKFKIVNSFQSNVTHVVVESDQTMFLNYDLLLSVLHGKWILSSEWIQIGLSPECHDLKEMDLDIFEMKFYTNEETPMRARLNAELQNPKLFNNCSFYFALNSNDLYPVGNVELSKKDLVNLCLAGGGCSLSREPNPEGISDQRIPFHVAEHKDHPLHKCSHYIIYSPLKDEPRIKYNMPHIKTLPLVWFIECIEKFTLIDPSLFGIM